MTYYCALCALYLEIQRLLSKNVNVNFFALHIFINKVIIGSTKRNHITWLFVTRSLMREIIFDNDLEHAASSFIFFWIKGHAERGVIIRLPVEFLAMA